MTSEDLCNPLMRNSFHLALEAERTRDELAVAAERRRLGLDVVRERIVREAIRTERMLRPYREVAELVRLEERYR